MAFADSFPSTLYVKAMETDETFLGGGVTFPADQELKAVYAVLFSKGVRSAADQARLLIYTDLALTKLYATGAWSNLATATAGATNWLGRVLLSFASPVNVEAGQTYFIAFEVDYARNGNTSYVGFALDWPLPVNDNVFSLGMELYALRKERF